MKRRKTKKKAVVFSQKRSFTDMVEKYGKQLIIGTIVLIALLGIFSNQLLKKDLRPIVVSPTPTTAVTPIVVASPGVPTPLKTKEAAVGALTNPVTTPPSKKLVTSLPLTSGESVSYTVKNGDSLAKLGVTFCNDKRAWIKIAEINKIYSPYTIQPGETLKISCR